MRNTLLKSVAASALIIGASAMAPTTNYVGSALAQSAETTTPSTDQAQPTSPTGDAGSATENDGSNTSAPSADSSAASSSETGETIVTEQKDTEVLASTYMGQNVYNSEDTSIGSISDLVFNKDGGIQAAVIGVGGFLGLGQKNVAVKFDRIKIETQPDSADVKLVTDMTADELTQAPEFKSLQTKLNEENAQKAPAVPTPAPADGMGTGTGTGDTNGGTAAPAQ